MTTDLATRATIGDLVRAYEQACIDIRQSLATLAKAESSMQALVGTDARSFRLHGRHYHGLLGDHLADDVIDNLRRDTWASVVERLQIRKTLSVARARELKDQLEKGELPELTGENVCAFARGYLARVDDMMTEAIIEVFERLRPRDNTRANEYKTNTQFEVGERVILTGMVGPGYGKQPWRVAYSETTVNELTALENVFRMLDNAGTPAGYWPDLYNAINSAPTDGHGATTYFTFRCCRNGNLHLRFNRLDLLARFNSIAGGMRIKPQRKEAA